jgi:hypothetical protein
LFLLLFSLTHYSISQSGFSSLSAKERLKIAKLEEVESEEDEEYQTNMKEGHELFQQGQYLKAVHKYELAGEKRPFNVYPKIIITDIELSMKDTLKVLRAEEERIKKEDQLKNNSSIEKKVENLIHTNEQKKLDEWERSERDKLNKEREQKNNNLNSVTKNQTGADVPTMSIEDFRKELGKSNKSGITELIYTEGNKTITKRIVVSNNLGDEYKKVVSNNWGGVFYFKNGVSITERIWDEETKK